MLDEYVIVASAAVIVAAVEILATLLYRYQRLVEQADKSSRLAKDVWDSVNSRFSVVDTRIIDLMARTDVLSSRLGSSPSTFQAHGPSASSRNVVPAEVSGQTGLAAAPQQQSYSTKVAVGTDTEIKVLRFLVAGPKTSAQIKEEVGRSREHTARLMKGLFQRGLVVRNDRNKPYVYEITESGRSYVAT